MAVNSRLLRDYVVRVSSIEGRVLGTGFFVTSELILTCAHVVRERRQVRVDSADGAAGDLGTVVVTSELPAGNPEIWPYPDLALIEVGPALRHPPVLLDFQDPLIGETLASWGYARREESGVPAGSPATFEFEGVEHDDYLKLKAGQAAPGLSGAPLVSTSRKAVVGVVAATRGAALDLGGYAGSISFLNEPSLADWVPWAEWIIAENQAENAADRAWQQVVSGEPADSRAGEHRVVYHPFEPLDDAAEVFGDENSRFYLPERAEYLNGQVFHPAELIDQAEAMLADGRCLIRGRGATGKTTLAISLGLRHQAGGGVPYYASMKEDQDFQQPTREILQIIDTLHVHATLLIIDDVHLDEHLVGAISRHWDRLDTDCKLLLLGRMLSTSTHGVDHGGLSRLESCTINMEVTDADLVASYRRIGQLYEHGSAIAEPAQPIVKAWHDLFGGDRFAFIVALRRRIEAHGVDPWISSGGRLEAADAISFIEERYLDAWPEARSDLVKLAACAVLELTAPAEALTVEQLARPLGAGIVHSSRHGRLEHRRFSLAHSGLGALIMTAARQRDHLSVLTGLAVEAPFFGFFLAARLERLGSSAEAANVLRVVTADAPSLAFGMQPTWAAANVRRVVRLGASSHAELDDRLSSSTALIQVADNLVHDLGNATSFLDFTFQKMPATAHQLVALLAERQRANSIAIVIPDELGHGTAFLEFSFRRMPETAELLVSALAEPAEVARLAASITRELGHATVFLRFIFRRSPKTGELLVSALAEPAEVARLAASITRELGHATIFLRFANEHMASVVAELNQSLANSANIADLAGMISHQLGNATTFLSFANRYLPKVAQQLGQRLAEPKPAIQLADAISKNLGNGTSFLEYTYQNFPRTSRQLTALLASPSRAKDLADAFSAELGNAHRFLEFAFSRLPDTARLLVDFLADPARAAVIADAVPNQLGSGTVFLEYAHRSMPEVALQLSRLLAEPARAAVIADAVPDQLGSGTVFLEYAHRSMPEVALQLSRLLADPARAADLADAVPDQLGNGTIFLDYAHQSMPLVALQLDRLMAGPARAAVLADAIPNDLGNGTIFLEYAQRKMPGTTRQLTSLLAQPAFTNRLADSVLSDVGHGKIFLQFLHAHLLPIAGEVSTLLATPPRPENLARMVKSNRRVRSSAYHIIDQIDLYDPGAAQVILRAIEPPSEDDVR